MDGRVRTIGFGVSWYLVAVETGCVLVAIMVTHDDGT